VLCLYAYRVSVGTIREIFIINDSIVNISREISHKFEKIVHLCGSHSARRQPTEPPFGEEVLTNEAH
jgi:hypothetical protein